MPIIRVFQSMRTSKMFQVCVLLTISIQINGQYNKIKPNVVFDERSDRFKIKPFLREQVNYEEYDHFRRNNLKLPNQNNEDISLYKLQDVVPNIIRRLDNRYNDTSKTSLINHNLNTIKKAVINLFRLVNNAKLHSRKSDEIRRENSKGMMWLSDV